MEGLNSEVFIPLRINTRKGRRPIVFQCGDKLNLTPFSKLLVKAYLLQKRLREGPRLSQYRFCELHKISPRYLRGIIQFYNLSPKLKKMIMNGWVPKRISVQRMLTEKMPLLWKEQEKKFLD